MGPNKAARIFAQRCPQPQTYRVTLYGSLAATGRGHLTDVAIRSVLEPLAPVEFVWKPTVFLPFHPNGMLFEGIRDGKVIELDHIQHRRRGARFGTHRGGAQTERLSENQNRRHIGMVRLDRLRLLGICR